MPLPASGEQIKKLGERLASGVRVSDGDLALLEELVACHMQVLEEARPRMAGLADTGGHVAAARDAPGEDHSDDHREAGPRARYVPGPDAGLGRNPPVGPRTFEQQDRLAAAICGLFLLHLRALKIMNRRRGPATDTGVRRRRNH